jgi:hypothetical protein
LFNVSAIPLVGEYVSSELVYGEKDHVNKIGVSSFGDLAIDVPYVSIFLLV